MTATPPPLEAIPPHPLVELALDDARVDRPQPRPGRAATVLMVIAVLLSTGALVSLRVPVDPAAPGGVDAGGDPFNQMVWGTLYVSSLGLLFASGRFVPALARLPRITWLLLALAVCSPLWSADPTTSIRRVLALGGSTVVGLYLGTAFDRRELLRISAWATLLAVVLSFAVGLAFPSFGISQDVRGAMWRGVFSHKSTLGLIMSWGVAMTVLQALSQRGLRRAGWLGVTFGAFTLLMLSGSRTGLVVLAIAALACWGLIRIVRAPRLLASGVVLVLVPLLVAALTIGLRNLDAITASLGRDVTLTGRTDIWTAVWPSIREQPWLGYGYDAFWGGPDSPARDVWARFGTGLGYTDFHPSSAHNAWLNLWLQLGVGAVALFAATLAAAFLRTTRAARAMATPAAIAPLLFALLYLCFTTVEGAMLTPNSIFWVLLVAYLVQEPAAARPTTSLP